MAKKNKLFSNPRTYKSKYYGQTEERKRIREERKILAKTGTEEFRRRELKPEKKGDIAYERFTLIMDSLPEEYRDRIRNKIKGEYYSSGDVLDAAQEIADQIDDEIYFSKYYIDQKLKEIKNRPATEEDMDKLKKFMSDNPDL